MPRLTHPDKLLWPKPEISKRALASYLVEMAPWMIQHLYGRPCSLVRAPDGIGADMFFQRHVMMGQPGSAKAVKVDDKHEPYLQFDDAQSIADVAQISAIEFHPWNCAPFLLRVPGRLVFDLDPGAGVGMERLAEAARELRQRLDDVGLQAFCKSSGGKGLHVVSPLVSDPGLTFDHAKLFSQTLCAQMAADAPDRYVINMAKRVRAGRIFLDYLRNDFTSTAVAPLSPRARPGATVSMPLTWTQVRKDLEPQRFTLSTASALLVKSGAWADYAEGARGLGPAVRKLIGDVP